MVPTPTIDEALAQAEAALDALVAVELDPSDAAGGLALARSVDRIDRKLRALQLGVVVAIGSRELHRGDGHASAPVMVGHANRLSSPEAKRRGRASRMLAEMPSVKAGLLAGRIGRCQVDRMALVFVNPRVHAEFVALDAQVAMLAAVLTYDEFDRRLANWVRQVDEDGTADKARRAHENRRARLVQDFDGAWELLCHVGGLTGAQMHTVFRAFVDAEFAADWEEARAIHGDKTTVEHLARTFDQRDADAIARIFELAANAYAAAPGGAPIDTVVVMDHQTLEREARRAAGASFEARPVPDLRLRPTDPDADPHLDLQPGPATGHDPDLHPGPDPASHPGRQFCCETTDGHPIDPTEAFANALVGRIRRTVVGWDSVVIDTSGRHRLFTGPLREAIMLGHHRCYWPGCTAPVAHCQGDHLDPRRNGARTNPGNGAPCCGRHNRLKEHGFTVRRDHHGRIHVHRPDGTRIE